MKTFGHKNPISLNLSTTPNKSKNYRNNNTFNITNNNYKYIYLSPKKQIITNLDNIEIKLIDLILFYIKLNNIYLSLNNNNYGLKKSALYLLTFIFIVH